MPPFEPLLGALFISEVNSVLIDARRLKLAALKYLWFPLYTWFNIPLKDYICFSASVFVVVLLL